MQVRSKKAFDVRNPEHQRVWVDGRRQISIQDIQALVPRPAIIVIHKVPNNHNKYFQVCDDCIRNSNNLTSPRMDLPQCISECRLALEPTVDPDGSY